MQSSKHLQTIFVDQLVKLYKGLCDLCRHILLSLKFTERDKFSITHEVFGDPKKHLFWPLVEPADCGIVHKWLVHSDSIPETVTCWRDGQDSVHVFTGALNEEWCLDNSTLLGLRTHCLSDLLDFIVLEHVSNLIR